MDEVSIVEARELADDINIIEITFQLCKIQIDILMLSVCNRNFSQ